LGTRIQMLDVWMLLFMLGFTALSVLYVIGLRKL
jgi:hypothetical protein